MIKMIAGGIVAYIVMMAIYISVLLAVLWAIWNWIVLPSLPYIHSILFI